MKKSRFNLTHERKFSCNFGELVPIFVEDVIPGDYFSNNTELLLRLAPQVAPVMHRVSVSTYFFYVPNRIIWRSDGSEDADESGLPHNGWEKYITGYDNNSHYIEPVDTHEPTLYLNYETTRTTTGTTTVTDIPKDRKTGTGTIFDYLYNIPNKKFNATGDAVDFNLRVEVSALPLRAYNLIFNEWFRDEDLQQWQNISFKTEDQLDALNQHTITSGTAGTDRPVITYTGDNSGHIVGADSYTTGELFHSCWEKDYFTSCRPWPQKGPAIPVTGDGKAPIKAWTMGQVVNPYTGEIVSGLPNANLKWSGLSSNTAAGTSVKAGTAFTSDTGALGVNQTTAPTKSDAVYLDPQGSLYADLKDATTFTINSLRLSFQTQKFLEKNARAGTRYVEHILSHFGVKSPDFRLDRPEYLGGGKSHIVFSEVLQTSETVVPTGSNPPPHTPQGNMAGHGFSAGRNHGFKRRFSEHGWIIGIIRILPRTAYQQGVPRRFNRKNRYDYYYPEFAHLGEQAVLNREIYVQDEHSKTTGDNPTPVNTEPFGYQAIWDEYRKRESSVHGLFQDDLAFWHMGRRFTAQPSLNAKFVHFNASESSDRVFAVKDQPTCWIQLVNHCVAVRPMPRKGIPGLIDH